MLTIIITHHPPPQKKNINFFIYILVCDWVPCGYVIPYIMATFGCVVSCLDYPPEQYVYFNLCLILHFEHASVTEFVILCPISLLIVYGYKLIDIWRKFGSLTWRYCAYLFQTHFTTPTCPSNCINKWFHQRSYRTL